MIKNILSIVIVVIVSILSSIGVYRYATLNVLEGNENPILGTSITTIAGSDTLSASRSVINTNFSNLNSGKFELTDWYSTTTHKVITDLPSLASIGTITTGVWNGTNITVAKGGTGTTTLSSNQVLLGDGSSGFKVVSGYGASGEFLTSNGASNAPTWTTGAVDTTLNYNWTGTNLFKNLNASSTAANPIVLNGVSLNTPSTQGASSTVLFNNGSGGLTWQLLPINVFYNNFANVSTSAAGTTTIKSLTIPTGTLSATRAMRGTVMWSSSTAAGAQGQCDVGFGNGTATTSIVYNNLMVRSADLATSWAEFQLFATSTTGQRFRSTTVSDQGYVINADSIWMRYGGYTSYNLGANTYLSFNCKQSGGSADIKLDNVLLEVLAQ